MSSESEDDFFDFEDAETTEQKDTSKQVKQPENEKEDNIFGESPEEEESPKQISENN